MGDVDQGVHAVAGVAHIEPQVMARRGAAERAGAVGAEFHGQEADAQRAAVGPHRVRGIGAEVEQHLVNQIIENLSVLQHYPKY